MSALFDDVSTRIIDAARTQPSVSSPHVTVTVTGGPDAGRTFEFDDLAHRRVLVGKSAACDVALTDATASRRHASLELDERGVWLKDLGSSNGTQIEGVLVRDALVAAGQAIRVGESSLTLTIGAEKKDVEASGASSFGRFVGASPGLRRLYPKLAKLAKLDVAILIEGEAGTGKELLAESIHEASARGQAPFVVFERGELATADAEAALFGREGEGGVVQGALEQASGGTLFIDEVFDFEMPLQLKLLRVLEKRSLRRVGGANAVDIDVRCIAATRRDLEREVGARRFREELLQFLSARVDLPPLRRRKGDIKLLSQFFWARLGGDPAQLSHAAIEKLEEYAWPGNVRELANAIAHQLGGGDMPVAEAPIEQAQREPDFLDGVVKDQMPFTRARDKVMAEFDRRYLSHMLAAHQGNIGRAAAAAGISRRYFYRLKAR